MAKLRKSRTNLRSRGAALKPCATRSLARSSPCRKNCAVHFHLGPGSRNGPIRSSQNRCRGTGLVLRSVKPLAAGTKENTNGLLRQYFPKGTDLRVLSAEEVTPRGCPQCSTEKTVEATRQEPRRQLGRITSLDRAEQRIEHKDVPCGWRTFVDLGRTFWFENSEFVQ